MKTIADAELVAGQGIVGDRYFTGTGTWSPATQSPKNEVTLIEAEEVERFNAAHGVTLLPEQLRRNLVTVGVGLNALVDTEFTIGSVVLKGIKLCEPCEYLAGLTDRRILPGLVHRAGLRAAIVRGGVISVHDAVKSRQVA